MFEILPNPSFETLVLVGRALMLIGAFWVFALAFIRWRRADERQAQRLHADLARAFAELRSLHETVTVMSARLESLAERSDAEARLAPAGAIAAQRGYDLAARLAKNGSNSADLVANCGITRHEAELLTRLHGAKGGREESSTAGWHERTAGAEKQPAASWLAPSAQAAEAAPAPKPSAARKRGSLVSVVG